MGTGVCRGGGATRWETGQRGVAGSEIACELEAMKTQIWQNTTMTTRLIHKVLKSERGYEPTKTASVKDRQKE